MGISTRNLVKVAVVGGLFVCGSGMFVQRQIRKIFCRQDFFQQSLDVLNNYPAGADLLGKPIEVQQVNLADAGTNWTDGNNAKVAIPLKGNIHSGLLHTWSTRVQENKWRVDKADLAIQDKQWTFYIHPDAREKFKPTKLNDDQSNANINEITQQNQKQTDPKDVAS